MIDLRSDTFIQPTPAMREAMAFADVDGDGHAGDHATTRLEEEVACMLGKQAALFTVTGTMGNALALLASDVVADGVLTDHQSHLVKRELDAPSPISHMAPFLVDAPDGAMSLEQVERWLETRVAQGKEPSVICTENTHTWRGGAVVGAAHLQSLRQLARRRNAIVHLDGARLFNAAVATGVPLATLAATADTVMINLCKGLGAPAGAVLAGPCHVIERARQLRLTLGGTLRKSGFYAAAALVALRGDWAEAIYRDHERAGKLSGVLRQQEFWHLAVQPSQSNIVHIDTRHLKICGKDLFIHLRSLGLLVSRLGADTVRLVTHRDMSDKDVDDAIAAFERVAAHPRLNIHGEQCT